MSKVEVKQPKFDIFWYQYQINVALSIDAPREMKLTKLKLLIQRAYEEGLNDSSTAEVYN